MQFIYFIPSSTGSGLTGLIKEAGLADILDDATRVTSLQIFNGPENVGGFLFSFCQPKDLQYDPKNQIWQKSNCGKYFIGFYEDSPPTEKELAREIQITGHKVKIIIGGSSTPFITGEWTIPLARIFPAGTRLPQSLILGANGEVIAETLPQFVLFSGRCEKLWNDFAIHTGMAEGEAVMTEAESFLLATEAIRINYRINIDGINALKLFTTQNLAEILLAVIDAPTVIKKLKELNNTYFNEKKNIIIPLTGHSASGSQEN